MVTSSAMRLGENAYVYATFAANSALLLLVIIEGIRTKSCRGLVIVDYLDTAVFVASSAATGDHAVWKHKPVVACHPATGRLAVVLRQDMALTLQV